MVRRLAFVLLAALLLVPWTPADEKQESTRFFHWQGDTAASATGALRSEVVGEALTTTLFVETPQGNRVRIEEVFDAAKAGYRTVLEDVESGWRAEYVTGLRGIPDHLKPVSESTLMAALLEIAGDPEAEGQAYSTFSCCGGVEVEAVESHEDPPDFDSTEALTAALEAIELEAVIPDTLVEELRFLAALISHSQLPRPRNFSPVVELSLQASQCFRKDREDDPYAPVEWEAREPSSNATRTVRALLEESQEQEEP